MRALGLGIGLGFGQGSGAAATPTDPTEDALWLFTPGNYIASGGPPATAWTWTADVGPNITEGGGGAGPPASGDDDPDWDDASNIRTAAATTIDDMFGALDGTAFARSGFVTLTPGAAGAANAGTPSAEDGIWSDLSYGALGLGISTTTGVTTARFWFFDGVSYVSTTATVTESARSTVSWRINWDGAAGYIQIGVDGTWEAQQAITTYPDITAATKKFIFGANTNATKLLLGPTHAAGFYSAIKDDAFFTGITALYA